MAEKVLKTFTVKYLQVLDESGKCDAKLMPKLSPKQLVELYELMVLCRKFDEKALSLQRQGRLGTYASFLGQEAAQVGAAYALGGSDWVFPTYRDAAVLVVRNQPMVRLFQYFGGDERGSIPPKGVNNFPIAIPVGTQGLHAVGAAMAATITKRKFATLACLGDGASSEGDMNEAFNFAGVFKAPVIFLCQNNQYAISVPVKQQTAAETLAQRAVGFGFEGVRVDGNDILAVYSAAAAAVKKAYLGEGPTLIECFTYRLGNHTTSDDASKYRSEAEVAAWRKKDPVLRFRRFLELRKLWNAKKEGELFVRAERRVSSAVGEYEKVPRADVDDIFKYTYSEMPQLLQQQMDDYKKLIEGR
ncbi:pyruvate dehydrogenase (acetyl-transferring) E1 component subunit alpha [Candidatus Woesearchaeota archaeon]|nr:pyruvate dehydrogenase (acetyl-transferring) E1 component subunit alpha [Candidatus Woesearchaeota archaeon]